MSYKNEAGELLKKLMELGYKVIAFVSGEPKDRIIRIRCTKNTMELWDTFVRGFGFRNAEEALRYLMAEDLKKRYV
jgi:hypothetical protein